MKKMGRREPLYTGEGRGRGKVKLVCPSAAGEEFVRRPVLGKRVPGKRKGKTATRRGEVRTQKILPKPLRTWCVLDDLVGLLTNAGKRFEADWANPTVLIQLTRWASPRRGTRKISGIAEAVRADRCGPDRA